MSATSAEKCWNTSLRLPSIWKGSETVPTLTAEKTVTRFWCEELFDGPLRLKYKYRGLDPSCTSDLTRVSLSILHLSYSEDNKMTVYTDRLRTSGSGAWLVYSWVGSPYSTEEFFRGKWMCQQLLQSDGTKQFASGNPPTCASHCVSLHSPQSMCWGFVCTLPLLVVSFPLECEISIG